MISAETLTSNRDIFNQTVYTRFDEAIVEIEKRRTDARLEGEIHHLLKGNIPLPFKNSYRLVLFRQLCTPNYETRRFLSIADAMDLDPLFWEYYNDKFTPNNLYKYYLGRMGFYSGVGKKGGVKVEYLKVIDFNSSNGDKIGDIKTLWGESLIRFHHELFFMRFAGYTEDIFFDASDWFSKNGETAQSYYSNYLALFLRHGILFENFVYDDKSEWEFTTRVFAPAFIDLWQRTGIKPLIVALEPTDTEGDEFWLCHPVETRNYVEGKLGLSNTINIPLTA